MERAQDEESRLPVEIGGQMSVRGSAGGMAPLYFPSRVVFYYMPRSKCHYCTVVLLLESRRVQRRGRGWGPGEQDTLPYGIALAKPYSNAEVHRQLLLECLCHPRRWLLRNVGNPGFSPLFC